MTRWKTLLAAVLVFVYPVAAGYCLLEKVDLVAGVDCCPETSSHDQEAACGGYGCCPIEYAVYSSLEAGVVDLIAPVTDVPFSAPTVLTEARVESPCLHLERSPPEIPQSWQFSFRTALPPRAPSSAS